MQIDEHNYAAYILDYFEGGLSAQERQELLDFLDRHPQYRKEFEEYEHIGLNDDEENFFSGKQELKKRTVVQEEEFFALSEGTVNEKEKAELEKMIQGNPALERELRLWNAAKAQPDLAVIYPEKKKLKRRPVVVPLWQNIYFRAAAVIALLAGAGWIYFARQNNTPPDSAMALQKNLSEKSQGRLANSTLPVPGSGAVLPSPQNNNALISKNSFAVRNTSRSNAVIKNYADTSHATNGMANQARPDTALTDPLFNHPEKFSDPQNHILIAVNSSDSVPKQEQHGIWGPEERAAENKRSFKRKILDMAVTCLRGLKKIGVKKADAVKKTDPGSGNTDYILVFGKRSYSTTTQE